MTMHPDADGFSLPGPLNTARLVVPSGLVCLAIYHRVTGPFLDSEQWWKIKHRFRLPERH
jgi:hypothetical protein